MTNGNEIGPVCHSRFRSPVPSSVSAAMFSNERPGGFDLPYDIKTRARLFTRQLRARPSHEPRRSQT